MFNLDVFRFFWNNTWTIKYPAQLPFKVIRWKFILQDEAMIIYSCCDYREIQNIWNDKYILRNLFSATHLYACGALQAEISNIRLFSFHLTLKYDLTLKHPRWRTWIIIRDLLTQPMIGQCAQPLISDTIRIMSFPPN